VPAAPAEEAMPNGKWITGLRTDTPLRDAARRVLAIRLETVRDYLGLALRKADEDSEYLHQLRVGTRRAAAALEIFAACLPDKLHKSAWKHLRRLRRAAGAARDWDVFLAALRAARRRNPAARRAGLDFLVGFALANRTAAQAYLEEASPDYPFGFERLLAEISAGVNKPPVGPRTLLELAFPLFSNLLVDLDKAVAGDLDDYTQLHQVRIVGKRLRYAMEVFVDCFTAAFREKLYPAVEEMQEILGRANDSHVAAQRLSTLSDKLQVLRPADWKRFRPGIQGLLHFHEKRLPEERRRFLTWWSRWQKMGGTTAFLAQLKTSGEGTFRSRPQGPAA
jgi:CHAD domain-containing protein